MKRLNNSNLSLAFYKAVANCPIDDNFECKVAEFTEYYRIYDQ